ncbi:MAG: HAMP domain-containing histidine kinase, partial [Gammaproteobacteria bacterium]|nr:HAMP domain-containing histidine kinase [Gammaproteobacteria bacterium]
MPKHGLRWKLGKAFLSQGLLIALVTILGVWASAYVLEEVLVKQALRDEASYFWGQHARDSRFPAPNTVNLAGYLSTAGGVPNEFRKFAPGFHELRIDSPDADYSVMHVSEHGGQRLYLVFDGARVNELAFYFGLVPLTAVLLVIYVAAWIAYRSTRRAVSPVIALAREVRDLDPQNPGAVGRSMDRFSHGVDEEVAVLADAMHQFAGRLEDYVERERNFTRDVSHELRSPLTVMKMAADMLMADRAVSDSARRSIARIKRAATDMEELVEAFLLLARESDRDLPAETVSINEIVGEEIEKSWLLIAGKPIDVNVEEKHGLQVESSVKVLSVLVGNLIRNAFSYTDA